MRNVTPIILFVITVVIGDRAIYLGAKRIVRSSQNQFVRMYEGKNQAGIIFLGDSRMDRNIDFDKAQRLTGKSCLNLGLGGNNVLVSEALLADYVERYGNPTMVVVELGHTTGDPGKMGEMRIFSYCSKNFRRIAQKVDPTYSFFENIFGCLCFNDPSFWRLAFEAFHPPSPRLLNNNIPDVLIKQWKTSQWRITHGGKRSIYNMNLQALRRICEFTDSQNIQLRLIISPCWDDFKKAIINYDDWKIALKKAAGKHDIYDYSDLFIGKPDFFNDLMHLNAKGANDFVEKLYEDKVL